MLARDDAGPDLNPADDRVKRELARELHDQVVQDLTVMLLDLESFKSRPFDRQAAAAQVDSVQGSLRSMLGTMRNLLYGLRDENAWEPGLAETLRVFAVEQTARTGARILVRVSREWPDPVRRQAAQHVYRVVHEAVTNARQHGGASSIRISLRLTERGFARVTVHDDGAGISEQGRTLANAGLGMLGMRERAALLGGTLNVGCGTTGGTCLRLVFPRSALV
jgi:two-component system sensor histidine kinase UhpB